MKSCFLFGHRDAPSEIRTRMEEAVERHYQEYGIRQFYVGGYGAFDSMAASAVKDAKKRHSDIELYLLIPYHPALRPVAVPEGFDNTFYPPLEGVLRRYAIVKANRYMAETCGNTSKGKRGKDCCLRKICQSSMVYSRHIRCFHRNFHS